MMGEFHEAVFALLQAFGHGLDIIKSQRGKRKREQLPIEPTKKNAESHLNKSLKKNRIAVKEAYGRNLARHGPEFAVGDGETFFLHAFFPLRRSSTRKVISWFFLIIANPLQLSGQSIGAD